MQEPDQFQLIMSSRRRFLVWLVSFAGVSAACAAPSPTPAPAASVAQAQPTLAPPPPTSLPTVSPTSAPPTATALTSTIPPVTATSAPPTASPTLTLPATAAPSAVSNTLEIVQPTAPGPEAFSQYAVEMRRLAVASGDQSFGAIIVKDNRVVGLGPSRVIVNRDPTAHAEIEAIRDACRRLGTTDLSGCMMYSTSRPCRMCETAAYWARLSRMYYGTPLTDGGAPQYCNC